VRELRLWAAAVAAPAAADGFYVQVALCPKRSLHTTGAGSLPRSYRRSERLTSPLTVGIDLGKRGSAQR
jgi:hypothetical protein